MGNWKQRKWKLEVENRTSQIFMLVYITVKPLLGAQRPLLNKVFVVVIVANYKHAWDIRSSYENVFF